MGVPCSDSSWRDCECRKDVLVWLTSIIVELSGMASWPTNDWNQNWVLAFTHYTCMVFMRILHRFHVMQIVALFCKVNRHHAKLNDGIAFATSSWHQLSHSTSKGVSFFILWAAPPPVKPFNVVSVIQRTNRCGRFQLLVPYMPESFFNIQHTHTLAVSHIVVTGEPMASSRKVPCLRHKKITCC